MRQGARRVCLRDHARTGRRSASRPHGRRRRHRPPAGMRELAHLEGRPRIGRVSEDARRRAALALPRRERHPSRSSLHGRRPSHMSVQNHCRLPGSAQRATCSRRSRMIAAPASPANKCCADEPVCPSQRNESLPLAPPTPSLFTPPSLREPAPVVPARVAPGNRCASPSATAFRTRYAVACAAAPAR